MDYGLRKGIEIKMIKYKMHSFTDKIIK